MFLLRLRHVLDQSNPLPGFNEQVLHCHSTVALSLVMIVESTCMLMIGGYVIVYTLNMC